MYMDLNKESYTPLERTESKIVLRCTFRKLAYSPAPSICAVIISVAFLFFLGVWIPGIQLLPFVVIPILVVMETLLLVYMDGEWQMTTVIDKGAGVISIERFRRSKKEWMVKGTMQRKQFPLENDMNISIKYQRYPTDYNRQQVPIHSITVAKRRWPADLFCGENLDAIVALKHSIERFLRGDGTWEEEQLCSCKPSYSIIRPRNGMLWIGCAVLWISIMLLTVWLTELEKTSVSVLSLSLLVITLVLATIAAVIFITILERKPIVRDLNLPTRQ